jgi:hypothetical protein
MVKKQSDFKDGYSGSSHSFVCYYFLTMLGIAPQISHYVPKMKWWIQGYYFFNDTKSAGLWVLMIVSWGL